MSEIRKALERIRDDMLDHNPDHIMIRSGPSSAESVLLLIDRALSSASPSYDEGIEAAAKVCEQPVEQTTWWTDGCVRPNVYPASPAHAHVIRSLLGSPPSGGEREHHGVAAADD